MKLRYKGKSFGAFGLTDGKVYECVEFDEDCGLFRVIDNDPNEPEGYLYSPLSPGPWCGSPCGEWEIVEDDEKETLARAIALAKRTHGGGQYG
jgi:hypothetical protein